MMKNPHDDTSSRTSWGLMVGLALPMLLASLGTSIANVALPAIARSFAVPLQSAQWIVLGYLLAITVVTVLAGRLGDVAGHRRVLVAGLAVFTTASLFCAASPALMMLVFFRVLQGAAAAAMMTLSMAMAREVVSPEETGRVMGLMGTTSAIGTALGPSLGGLLVAGAGWQAVFAVQAALGLAGLLVAHFNLPASQQPRGGLPGCKLDAPGLMLLVLTLLAYAFAMTRHFDAGGGTAALLLGIAAAGAWLFFQVERRSADPLVDFQGLAQVRALPGFIMNLLVAAVMMATLVIGPFVLTAGLGIDMAQTGFVMAVGPAMSAASGVPAGRLVDALGARRGTVLGLALMLAGMSAFALLPGMYGVAGFIAAVLVLTPGYQLFQAANNAAVMNSAPKEQRGVVSGILGLSRNLGLVTGASLMPSLFAAVSGAPAGAEAILFGAMATFALAAALVAVALVLSVVEAAGNN